MPRDASRDGAASKLLLWYCRRKMLSKRPEKIERPRLSARSPHQSSCDRSTDSEHQAESGGCAVWHRNVSMKTIEALAML